jgi:signal transduction histidine kinase
VSDKTSPDLHGSISDLNDALKDVSDVVTQMISLTTPEPGFCDMSNALVELTTYIHRQIETVADFQADIPNVACAVGLSRARALEVVASLLNNAMRAVESVTSRTTHISLRLTQHEEMVVVEVTDNGVGMTPDVRRQALNPFFTTRRPGALGMGLSFAAMTVRRAGGEVLIDSEPDVGTNVRLFLPRMSVSSPASGPNN